MKILKHIKVVFLASLLAITTSCSESYLNPEPNTSIPTEEIFKSYITAEAALVGMYDQFSSYTFEGLNVPIMSDVIGEDIMINSVDNWNRFVVVYQLDVLPTYSYVDEPWWTAYKVLYDANQIIENAKTIPDATEEQKDWLEGQAKTMRAYIMLKLINIYAPSYYVDKTAPGILNANRIMGYDEDPLTRASVEEIYTQIENDCLSAIGLLETNSSDDVGFFNKRASQAILARAYLDMHKWEEARDMAVEAYKDMELMTIDEMYTSFTYRNRETIFTIAYTAEDNNIFMSLPSFYWPVSGYSSIRANNTFVDYFDESDARKAFLVQDDEIDENRHFVLKFASNGSVGNAERICIRASEMYLIAAECEAELGNLLEAREALHKVQERSMPGTTLSTNSGQDLIDEILLERRKELFGEGFRWNDIKRRNLPFKRTGDHWVDFDFSATDQDYYRFTYPIPQSEIDANVNLTQADQNKGY